MIQFVLIALASLASGCTYTIAAVNPKPNVVVSVSVGKACLDSSKIDDVQRPAQDGGQLNFWKVSITDFRTTLENGFRNALGSHYAADGNSSMKLVLDSAELRFANLANIGRFLTIRYRAHWTNARGQLIAEMAGVAQPRNPTETGRRHLEDVVEVLYEQAIDGLRKAHD